MLKREPSVAEVRERLEGTRHEVKLQWRDLSAAFEKGEEVSPGDTLLRCGE